MRKKMNVSDDAVINGYDKNAVECVDVTNGAYCQRRTFMSSGRATYMFFSDKLYRRQYRCLGRLGAEMFG